MRVNVLSQKPTNLESTVANSSADSSDADASDGMSSNVVDEHWGVDPFLGQRAKSIFSAR